MKTTKFEQTITIGMAESLAFLDNIIKGGLFDEDVTSQMYAYAVEMREAFYDAFDEYSTKSLELHGVED